ncbi:MAG: hypothetical protein P4M09_17675 [Devosia sp.]|nr:hypothetical protein [Devosia sp.]
MGRDVIDIGSVLTRLGQIAALPREATQRDAATLAAEQLQLAEAILMVWVKARGAAPTTRRKEGFRLLSLHAQGARGEPSFNACRETCREIVFRHNVVLSPATEEEREYALRLMTMVVRHLAHFVSGKLEVAGLGEFCCASRPLRQSSDGAGIALEPSGV